MVQIKNTSCDISRFNINIMKFRDLFVSSMDIGSTVYTKVIFSYIFERTHELFSKKKTSFFIFTAISLHITHKRNIRKLLKRVLRTSFKMIQQLKLTFLINILAWRLDTPGIVFKKINILVIFSTGKKTILCAYDLFM